MKICVSIGETSATAVLKRLDTIADADLFEVRFDHLPDNERNKLVDTLADSDVRSKMIATLRPIAEGGRSTLSGEERMTFFSRLRGYYACDLEEDIAHISPDTQKKIVSFHDHSGVPEGLERIFGRLLSHRPDIVKIACTVDDAAAAIPLWNLLERAVRSTVTAVPIAMGEAGKWTRIFGPAFGAPIVYAAADSDSATAAGQFTISDLKQGFRIGDITRNTAVYGVIGDPVSSSLSPAMHNAAFAANGDNAVFIPFQVKDLEAFFGRMVKRESREVELNFQGFAVTMPHKLAVMDILDEIDPNARKIGAVNTVLISDGRLIGKNTDADGFLAPLISRFGDIGGMRFAVIGAGGAARACVHALNKRNADVTLYVRNAEKAGQGFNSSAVRIAELKEAESLGDPDVVVNTTPVGMNGERLFSVDQLSGVRCVYDLITKETPLLEDSRRAGIDTIGGREMLLEQGILQYEAWMKRPAPRDAMRRALIEEEKWVQKP